MREDTAGTRRFTRLPFLSNFSRMKFTQMSSTIHLATYLIVICAFVQGCQRNVSGTYSGACINETYGGRGELILILNQRDNMIGGSLTVSGDLSGGGAISGRIDGSSVTFTTSDMIMGQITWTGEIRGREIQGQYFVETPVLTSIFTGAQNQRGIWAVSRK